jgi:endoglucanase
MKHALAILAAVVVTPLFAADQVTNGTFDAGLEGWWTTPNLTAEIIDGKVCAKVPGGLTNPWDAIIGQDNVVVEKGESYDFAFTASGDPKGPVRALVQEAKAPYTAYIETVPQTTPEAQEVKIQFTALVSDDKSQVVFQVGGSAEPWTVCLDNIQLAGGAEVKAYRPETGSSVRVNQFGYLPDGPKRATWVSDEKTAQGWTFRGADGNVILRGQTVPMGLDASSGLTVHLIDFSEVSETGDGFMIGAGGERSHPFSIKADLYAGLLSDALAYFYPVRSGIAIDGALAGEKYAREAGHLGVAPNTGDTAVPCQAPESSQKAYGEAWTCDYTLDVTGGWYDAGDHGKYVVNGGISVAQVLAAYARDPAGFGDGDMKIPEAGNGVPDILDEARWQIDFMLKMVVPDGKPMAGMVHHKVHDSEWTGLPLMPHLDDKTRELHRPSTAATLNVSAVAAMGARLWKGIDDDYSAKLLAVARSTYAAAKANPAVFATPEDGASGGGPYDDTQVTDEFWWAAAELYLATGEAEWLAELDANKVPEEMFFPANGAWDWKNVATFALTELLSVPSDYPLPARDDLRYRLIAAADKYLETQGKQAWGQIYAPEMYDWGSNHLHVQNALVVALAYDITEDAKYRAGVLEAMDYIFGRNALNLSYVTGYGTAFAQNQHSRWFAASLNPDLPHPPKGALAGGPNSSIQDPVAQRLLQGCAPQFCYVDDIQSWSTNEITINWNAALVQIASILKGY